MNTHPYTYLPTVTHNRQAQTHTKKQCGLVDSIKFSGHGDLAGVVNLYLTCEENLYMNIWRHREREREMERQNKRRQSKSLLETRRAADKQRQWETGSRTRYTKK